MKEEEEEEEEEEEMKEEEEEDKMCSQGITLAIARFTKITSR